MDDLRHEAPQCSGPDCGYKVGAAIFFLSYCVVQAYLLTNLFVALVIEFVAEGLMRADAVVDDKDVERFQAWAQTLLACLCTIQFPSVSCLCLS